MEDGKGNNNEDKRRKTQRTDADVAESIVRDVSELLLVGLVLSEQLGEPVELQELLGREKGGDGHGMG